jgi:ABC-2 type transport system ATP-binding protein
MNTLHLENVTKRYADKTAVHSISIAVKPGEIFGLLGANGAGKTTTMRMVLGLIQPDEGTILYQGRPHFRALNRLLGYLPEERGLYPKVKVHEQIKYLAELRGMSRKDADRELRAWLERFQVPENYDKKVEELSKGNQQKIQFIAAIIHKPEIVIMDEAFSGLDPVNVELLKDTVKQLRDEGTTILFSSHRMEHVEELCENICILHRSETVLQGNLKDIKRSYPRERVILETEAPVEGLEQIPGVLSVERQQNGYQLRIKDTAAASEALNKALAQTQVNRYQIMEPTLNEIFIRKVGNVNE